MILEVQDKVLHLVSNSQMVPVALFSRGLEYMVLTW